MIRIFLFFLGGYILIKLVRSILFPKSFENSIESDSFAERSNYKNLNISDAEFEDINERNK